MPYFNKKKVLLTKYVIYRYPRLHTYMFAHKIYSHCAIRIYDDAIPTPK